MARLIPALLVAASLTLGGCALSPQHLELQPLVNGPFQAVGQGQPVTLTVVDGRPSPVIGTRGGIYAGTSTISVAGQSLMPRLQAQADAGLRLLGFTPSAQSGTQMTLTLTEIKYATPKDDSYVTEANISAVFRAEVQNNGRRYTGRYAASLNQRFGMAPNEQTNSKLVSDVVSDALSRVFRDPSIGQALR